jgi:hypothetical protein
MKKINEWFLKLSVNLIIAMNSCPLLAALPTPPSADMPDGSNDWIDVGGTLIAKVVKVTCIGLGAVILIGTAGGIIKAYQVAHDKQDLGHFFKMLIVGLIAAAIGLGLVYAGYTIVSSSS